MNENTNSEALKNLEATKGKVSDPGLKQAISDKIKVLTTNQTVKK